MKEFLTLPPDSIKQIPTVIQDELDAIKKSIEKIENYNLDKVYCSSSKMTFKQNSVEYTWVDKTWGPIFESIEPNRLEIGTSRMIFGLPYYVDRVSRIDEPTFWKKKQIFEIGWTVPDCYRRDPIWCKELKTKIFNL